MFLAPILLAIKVGVILPLTGSFAPYGVATRHAMELAREQVKGSEVELFFEDNPTCGPKEAMTAFQRLVSNKKATVVVTFCTGAAQAILPLASAKKVPLIQLTESGPDAANYMLKLMPDTSPFATILGSEYAKKYKKMALIGTAMEVNSGQKGNMTLFRKAFEAGGGSIVFTEETPPDTTDFNSIIAKIQQSDAEAVSPFLWSPADMSAFLKQADDLNLWSKKELAGNFIFELMYRPLQKVYPKLDTMEGLLSSNFKEKNSQQYAAQYKEKFKEEPAQFSENGYDAVVILKACGADPKCYREKRNSISGEIAFSENGQREGEYTLTELKSGKFVAKG